MKIGHSSPKLFDFIEGASKLMKKQEEKGSYSANTEFESFFRIYKKVG